jgi:hypothetical protein
MKIHQPKSSASSRNLVSQPKKQGIKNKKAERSCLQNRLSNEQRIKVRTSFICAAGQEIRNKQESCAVKIRVELTGGIPLKSLRMAAVDDGQNSPVYDTWQDTWPIEDLVHDIFSQNFDTEYDVLAHALQTLLVSDAAKSFINDAAGGGWEIGLSDLGDNAFHIDVPLKKIIINNNGLSPIAIMRTPHFRHLLSTTLVRALRDVWHEKRNGGFDEKFNVESILMLERVRAADCDAMIVLAAWQLRAAGQGDMWRHVLASDEGDLAVAFGCVLEKDKGDYAIHKALEAAFNQWYGVQDRVMLCDHASLEYVDEVLRNKMAPGNTLASAFDIEVLSCLPDRTAYLQGCGANILRAPLYAGLHDVVNQSHFMQIVHDMSVTYTQGVPFRDASLAAKIFPGGRMTAEEDTVSAR